jgi:hypothetical protein
VGFFIEDTMFTVIIVTGIFLLAVVFYFTFYFRKKYDLKTRPILTYEGNIMSLEQYRTMKKSAMKTRKTMPLMSNTNANNDNKK